MCGCGTCRNRRSPTRFASTLTGWQNSEKSANVRRSGWRSTRGPTWPVVKTRSRIRHPVVQVQVRKNGRAPRIRLRQMSMKSAKSKKWAESCKNSIFSVICWWNLFKFCTAVAIDEIYVCLVQRNAVSPTVDLLRNFKGVTPNFRLWIKDFRRTEVDIVDQKTVPNRSRQDLRLLGTT